MAFNSQRVVILAGLPASGKTTLSKRLGDFGFVWINQVGVTQSTHTASLHLYEDIVQEPHEPYSSRNRPVHAPRAFSFRVRITLQVIAECSLMHEST